MSGCKRSVSSLKSKKRTWGKPKGRVSLYKKYPQAVWLLPPPAAASACSEKHVKTASYNINMYKYITNTRSFRHADRRNRGRKHENNLIKKRKPKTKREPMKMEKISQTVPLGTSPRLNCRVLRSKVKLGGDSSAVAALAPIVRTSQCNGSLFLLRQMLDFFFSFSFLFF